MYYYWKQTMISICWRWGPIPITLKQRILRRTGASVQRICPESSWARYLHNDMKAVFLGHLSKENNYAELAYETVKLELMLNESPYKPGDFPMWVASRDEQSECVGNIVHHGLKHLRLLCVRK